MDVHSTRTLKAPSFESHIASQAGYLDINAISNDNEFGLSAADEAAYHDVAPFDVHSHPSLVLQHTPIGWSNSF